LAARRRTSAIGSIAGPMGTAGDDGHPGRTRTAHLTGPRAAHPSGLPWPDELATPEPIVRLSGRQVYRNPWITVREDVVRFPHGHEGIYGVVTTNPCVGMLPFVDDHHVALVRQWRYVTGEPSWEMPTGGNRPGERPEHAAQRELKEEIGLAAGRLQRLAIIDSSKSVVEERATLFAAHDLRAAEADELDVTEHLQVAVFPFTDVVAMVKRSEIVDAMTVVAVLHMALDVAERRSGST
jgi:8-oxo-dGTP pyrophosphatase MutT (NUDIX family)